MAKAAAALLLVVLAARAYAAVLAQTPVTAALLSEAGIVPDVIR